jgi:outer membrane protein OmpU
MNKFKKIGLTALAASLVSVSANAGEISVSGSASMGVTGKTGEGLNVGTSFSMGNQLTFSGSGELDNGLNVSLSFVLDQGDDATLASVDSGSSAPFDSHSVTVSSDAMGSLTFNGEGGATASSTIAGTAAGNLWDSFDQLANGSSITFVDLLQTATAGNASFMYTSPELTDGLTAVISYQPQGSNAESAMGYGVNYVGAVEGLSLHYATTEVDGTSAATRGDNTAMKVSYAIGSVTAAYSHNEMDMGSTSTDYETSSLGLTYTVSDELSVTVGTETHESTASSTVDAEIDGISFAYTAGGMTISGGVTQGENLDYSTSTAADVDEWTLGASFAF